MALFEAYTQELVAGITSHLQPIEPVDAFEFVTGSSYLNEDPTPFQRLVVKIFYGLWGEYPPDREEQVLLDLLQSKWHITIDIDRQTPVTTLIMVLGRRATKSTLLSFLATYGVFTLVCRGNPQEYYHIRTRHPIYITHVAGKEDQAKQVFRITSDNIRKVPFFRPYIDFDKNNSTELRLFTPYDLILNEKIRQRNHMLPRGAMKEDSQVGSLYVKSITTSAATNRGDATYLLLLSELAHFKRTKLDPSRSEDQMAEENPQSDYAIVKALVPATKDFGDDGRVVMESSPAEKGGELYRHYCIGSGMEQEDFESVAPEQGYQVLQFATWEARPSISRESLNTEFRKDPAGANMEYGAHFGNPSGTFISEQLISAVPIAGRAMLWENPGILKFFIILDPGGKAKLKVADTYAVGWGHYEGGPKEENVQYYIDGLYGFDAKLKALGAGRFERILVNPNVVVDFVIDLCEKLGGKNYIVEICYDQFDSTGPVATLQSFGYPAIETTFTNPYKAEMYGNFLQRTTLGQVHSYGIDEGGWIGRWKLEMKFLQQDIAGGLVYYHHPSSGPVQHDDFADVTANLVHRMCLRAAPTKDSVKDARKHGTGPMMIRHGVKPVKGPPIHRGNIGAGIRSRLR